MNEQLLEKISAGVDVALVYELASYDRSDSIASVGRRVSNDDRRISSANRFIAGQRISAFNQTEHLLTTETIHVRCVFNVFVSIKIL